jgi:MarR-like DNA-binding transcriptional regulator SgrR of sgrS sRNA
MSMNLIQMRFSVGFAFFFWRFASMALATEFSVGFYTPAFPRDPLNVNVYLEHVLLGQTIEPLFTLGDDGLIKGAVAEKWQFNDKRDELTIFIRENLSFSNKSPLTSKDVVYSLERHRLSEKSQSYNYLKIVKQIVAIDEKTVKIVLNNQYTPILLALSRDHLGILPQGWNFDAESLEPFIGSGPYRIVKENNSWVLSINKQFRNPESVRIKRWKLDIIDVVKNIFPRNPPDLILQSSKPNRIKLMSLYKKFESTHQEVESFSFMQSSFWWVNEKYSARTSKEREKIRAVLNLLSEKMVQKMGGELSTGIIPKGIAGSLPERPTYNTTPPSKITFRIIVPDWFLVPINECIKDYLEFGSSGVKIEVDSYTAKDMRKISQSNADLVLISYAGGFFDPEGFLVVLPSMVGKTTKDMFGEKSEVQRIKASSEMDGNIRAKIYREISKSAQDEIRYVPGWLPTFTEFRSMRLSKKPSAFKYSYKLIDYQEK